MAGFVKSVAILPGMRFGAKIAYVLILANFRCSIQRVSKSFGPNKEAHEGSYDVMKRLHVAKLPA